MTVFTTQVAVQNFLKEKRRSDMTIGLIPTMGALHKGHLELVSKSLAENDITICSIYVNPRQFNNPRDLEKYPRTFDDDLQLLNSKGCDAVFHPADSEIYTTAPEIGLNIGRLGTIMEGRHRPGHFEGMALVVCKFFNILKPTRAYFGQKDLQQLRIIEKMVTDLSFDLEVRSCPIVRDADGLALSSRNIRLSHEERTVAPFIYKSLQKAAELIKTRPTNEVKAMISDEFSRRNEFQLEYMEICNAQTLEPIDDIRHCEEAAICIAAYLGDVRLIDNLLLIP